MINSIPYTATSGEPKDYGAGGRALGFIIRIPPGIEPDILARAYEAAVGGPDATARLRMAEARLAEFDFRKPIDVLAHISRTAAALGMVRAPNALLERGEFFDCDSGDFCISYRCVFVPVKAVPESIGHDEAEE